MLFVGISCDETNVLAIALYEPKMGWYLLKRYQPILSLWLKVK